ncbi:MAG: Gfo/Idh/MocA family oxidoreductase [Chloroflexota bacterium]|jgi:predicted dehydrogenase|nr:Gfo/Idh/MocA family oxidoreductase [Chloroflexota bacterium]MDP6509493.1 Gfo/Idh/MocA family oxidoreductase [Chloroflexota bacterium]MDP6757229.1 Gfo/Idh/MocA family oxidoreductase [Chloroflexota bacterium]
MASAETVKWGVISTSNIGMQRVIPAIQAAVDTAVVAISSRDAARAKDAAAELGIPRSHGSYEELLADPDIQVVYNPLPNGMHHEWVLKAAAAGKHSLCEKPMADDVAQAIAMTEASARHNVLLMEAFMWRFGNRAQRARELIRAGAIGDPRLVRTGFSFPLARDPANVRYQRELSGGALEDAGGYAVSATRFMLDAEPLSVEATMRWDEEFDVNTSGVASLVYPDGRTALVDFSFEQERRQLLEIVGAEGSIEIEGFILPATTDSTIRIARGGEVDTETFPPVNFYTLQAEAMNRAVTGGEPLPWDGDDAIRQVRVLDAIRESHNRGVRVELAPHRRVDTDG